MCIAIPARIIERIPGTDLATADVIGITRQINIGLLGTDAVESGEWVLIHSGFAMSKMDEAEARTSLEFLGMLAASDPMNPFADAYSITQPDEPSLPQASQETHAAS